MSAIQELKYRVIYEQLSRFSGNLSQTTSLDAVSTCLRRHLKYIFDYQLIRLCFYQQNTFIVYTLSLTDAVWQTGDESLLWAYEQQFRGGSIPAIRDDARLQAKGITILTPPENVGQLWHWDMAMDTDSGVLVSVFSVENRPFQPADVTVLKIVLENLHAKILSIRLVDELSSSKRAVDEALIALRLRNETISLLVATQEAVIQQRTQALEQKNAQLVELSRQHAHTLREPLSRLLSLAYLIEALPAEAVVKDIIPALVATSSDLDTALQQVICEIDTHILFSD